MTIWKLFCLLRHKQYCSACVAVRQLLDWQYSSRLRSRTKNILLFHVMLTSIVLTRVYARGVVGVNPLELDIEQNLYCLRKGY